ncbi:MAG: IS1634 family transposase [Gemmatimonadaceae bacterium]|nr:IS1634 family transposase [Gemmatimonadaceae bacterium]
MRTVTANGIEYLQLVHNEWVDGRSKTRVLYGFGRKSELDLTALERLAQSILRFVDPDAAQEIRERAGLEAPFEFLGAKTYGGAFVLDAMWQRLGIKRALSKSLAGRGFAAPIERVLFALVAHRAIDPGSKLAAETWVKERAFIPDLPGVEVQQLYRAMDYLLEAHDEIQRDVFWSVRNLFNLEVDVLFIDTTSTYFEIEGEDDDEVSDAGGEDDSENAGASATDEGVEPDAAAERERRGLRKRSKNSKDSRPDLAQAVIGFAVTKTGIPVRCWVWPGNTVDATVIDEVKRDLNEWKLDRIVAVMDTGFNSEANRKTLQGAGDAFIIGEKMRLGKDGKPPEALKRPGRYKTLANGLRVKEVIVNKGSVTARRFVIVHNLDQATRDQEKRDDIVRETERRLANLQQLDGKAHHKATCELRAHGTFGRYVRQTKGGKLAIDKAKIATEAKLDGKYLISTSDDHLSAEDVAMGYKQLHEIERVNRDLKHVVDVRPVYHRKRERIKAHVLLCWLALLLIRVIENETHETWHNLKNITWPLMVGQHRTQHGLISQSSTPTTDMKRVLDALNVKPPKRYLELPRPQKA